MEATVVAVLVLFPVHTGINRTGIALEHLIFSVPRAYGD